MYPGKFLHRSFCVRVHFDKMTNMLFNSINFLLVLKIFKDNIKDALNKKNKIKDVQIK